MTVFMYMVSKAHWLGMAMSIKDSLPDSESPTAARDNFKSLAATFLPFINYALSDAIVLWRAWVICGKRGAVLLVPGGFLLCCIVCAILSIGTSIVWKLCGARTAVDVATVSNPLFCLFAALTNICATALVGWKTWKYWHDIKRNLDAGDNMTLAGKLLLLLVESGSIYSCIMASFPWVSLALSFWVPGNLSLLISPCFVQISGIYPTVIVVLAALQKTRNDRFLVPSVFVAAENGTGILTSSTNNTVTDLRPATSEEEEDKENTSSAETHYPTSKSRSSGRIVMDVTDAHHEPPQDSSL